jgi:hypothetical protein
LALALAVTCLPACSWFTAKRPPPPGPTEIIVTGAPIGSIVFLDGGQIGQPALLNDRPQMFRVPSGAHTVDIRVGDPVVYREEVDLRRGEHRVVTVLSGSQR